MNRIHINGIVQIKKNQSARSTRFVLIALTFVGKIARFQSDEKKKKIIEWTKKNRICFFFSLLAVKMAQQQQPPQKSIVRVHTEADKELKKLGLATTFKTIAIWQGITAFEMEEDMRTKLCKGLTPEQSSFIVAYTADFQISMSAPNIASITLANEKDVYLICTSFLNDPNVTLLFKAPADAKRPNVSLAQRATPRQDISPSSSSSSSGDSDRFVSSSSEPSIGKRFEAARPSKLLRRKIREHRDEKAAVAAASSSAHSTIASASASSLAGSAELLKLALQVDVLGDIVKCLAAQLADANARNVVLARRVTELYGDGDDEKKSGGDASADDLRRLFRRLEVARRGPVDPDEQARELAELKQRFESATSDEQLSMLRKLIGEEIDFCESYQTLFRGRSPATILASIFLKAEGKEYIRRTLAPVLESVAGPSVQAAFEVDPRKLGGDEVAAARQVPKLITACYSVLEAIYSSKVPYSFGQLFQFCQQAVVKRFPQMKQRVVGGLFFLRFVCPELVMPSSFQPSSAGRRNLILVSKVLQNIANDVEFGGKESFMMFANDFVAQQRERMSALLDRISVPVLVASQDDTDQMVLRRRNSVSLQHGQSRAQRALVSPPKQRPSLRRREVPRPPSLAGVAGSPSQRFPAMPPPKPLSPAAAAAAGVALPPPPVPALPADGSSGSAVPAPRSPIFGRGRGRGGGRGRGFGGAGRARPRLPPAPTLSYSQN
jgi:GTPase-activator protein for Ras-like GTPase